MEIKKAIVPIAGLGTRFLPLSTVFPKGFWPLVDEPVIQYIIREIKRSGISQIIFIVNSEKSAVVNSFKNYFKRFPKLEQRLKKQNKTSLLQEIQELQKLFKDLSFSFVLQKEPLGDGHAIFQARNLVKGKPVAVSFGDDIVDSKIPCTLQLIKIFRTAQKPVIALCQVPKEKVPSYGIVKVEKIANRLYKIKKIVEKPAVEESPSDLAIVGKYILTPEVFDYLEKAKPSKKGEIILADVFDKMIREGKVVYGYQFKGNWLSCGSKLNWMKCNFYLSLKHPKFGPELKEYLKTLK